MSPTTANPACEKISGGVRGVAATQQESHREQCRGGQVRTGVGEPESEHEGSAGDRAEIEQSEQGSGDGAEDADRDRPGRGPGPGTAVAGEARREVEDE